MINSFVLHSLCRYSISLYNHMGKDWDKDSSLFGEENGGMGFNHSRQFPIQVCKCDGVGIGSRENTVQCNHLFA